MSLAMYRVQKQKFMDYLYCAWNFSTLFSNEIQMGVKQNCILNLDNLSIHGGVPTGVSVTSTSLM